MEDKKRRNKKKRKEEKKKISSFPVYEFLDSWELPASGTFPFSEAAAPATNLAVASQAAAYGLAGRVGHRQFIMMAGHDFSPLQITLLIPAVPGMQLEFDMGRCSALAASIISCSASRIVSGKLPFSLSIPIHASPSVLRPKFVMSSQTDIS